MATIRWQDVYKLDTTGMSPEYAKLVTDALEQAQASRTGQELFKDLLATTKGNPTRIALADMNNPEQKMMFVDSFGVPIKRIGIYDSEKTVIGLNPRLLELEAYRDPVALAHQLIHESDHAVRDADMDKIKPDQQSRAEVKIRMDDADKSAQDRANRFYTERGRAAMPYIEDGAGQIDTVQKMPREIIGEDEIVGFTAKNIVDALQGTGEWSKYSLGDVNGDGKEDFDTKRMSERVAELAQNGVTAKQIQDYLEQNPQQAQTAAKDNDIVPPDTQQFQKKSVQIGS